MHVLCVTLFVVQCVTDTVGGAFPLFFILYCFIEHCFILYCIYCIVLLHRVLLHIALLHIVLSVSDDGGPSRQGDYHILDIGERLSNYWQYIGPTAGAKSQVSGISRFFSPAAVLGQKSKFRCRVWRVGGAA